MQAGLDQAGQGGHAGQGGQPVLVNIPGRETLNRIRAIDTSLQNLGYDTSGKPNSPGRFQCATLYRLNILALEADLRQSQAALRLALDQADIAAQAKDRLDRLLAAEPPLEPAQQGVIQQQIEVCNGLKRTVEAVETVTNEKEARLLAALSEKEPVSLTERRRQRDALVQEKIVLLRTERAAQAAAAGVQLQ